MNATTVKKTSEKATKKVASEKPTIHVKSIAKNADVLEKKDVKQEEVKTVEKTIEKAAEPVLTLEQKIEKVENLKTLIDKREKLEDSRKKLSSFVIGTNQFNESLVLTDENNNNFRTSNSEVFTKVVQAINSTLVEKIKEIEMQIKF